MYARLSAEREASQEGAEKVRRAEGVRERDEDGGSAQQQQQQCLVERAKIVVLRVAQGALAGAARGP